MGFEDFDQARRFLRMGIDIANQVETANRANNVANARKTESDLNRDANQINAEDRAFKAGMNSVGADGVPNYELKEMTCPNCGAKMSPNEASRASGALGSINCPYCGSEIVVNDEVKNAQYVHDVEMEQKRVDLENRRMQYESEKMKSDRAHEEFQNTLNTIDSIERNVSRGMNFVSRLIAIFTFVIFAIILLIILSIVLKIVFYK